jgi:23S rRNA (uracil1939-C5)-methyltransferase
MSKKEKQVRFEKVTIGEMAAEGKCVARVNDKVIFTEFLAPGDVADIRIYKTKKKFAFAKAEHIHEYSTTRTTPVCEHFGTCGGCKWQHITYENQAHYKEKQVKDNLERIGKINVEEYLPIVQAKTVYNYRNKLEFSFSDKRWLTNEEIGTESTLDTMNGLGFHVPERFDKVLDIKKCHLQEEPSNAIRLEIRKFALEHQIPFYNLREHLGVLRNLIIRNTSLEELMVILQVRELTGKVQALLEHLKITFPEITSLQYVVNTKSNDTFHDLDIHLFHGKPFITEQMENLQFRISPKSFYQTNSAQAYELYKVTREFAGLTGNENVYDLYTGTGTIANFVAAKAKKVTGIEYVPMAIEDAKINSSINNIHNTSFYAGDVKDLLTDSFLEKEGLPDVIITDPPRAGMHEHVIQKILELAPKRIVYVSCNPATQARDLALMNEKYAVKKVRPVDMFPQTHHVENVALLEKIN